MLVYKLVRKLKDDSITPLFINKKLRIPIGVWLEGEDHQTKGYLHRKGWHCTLKPYAPHLYKKENRIWMLCEVQDFEYYSRPEHQGGTWILVQNFKFIKEIKNYGDTEY